ncbi:MAG: hypothetical protein JXB32_00950 [Deltaproteobacteria bacterium]|nr:hypothetical protein [Deltaproteobacteria bacterium]
MGSSDDVPRLPPDDHPYGPLQEHHGRAWTRVVGQPLLALLLPLAGTAMALVARYVPEVDRDTAGKVWFVLIAAFVGSAVILWRWWREIGLGVDVHERGFVLHRRGQAHGCAWDDVAEVWPVVFDGAVPGRDQKPGTLVVTRTGERLALGKSLARWRKLGDRVRAETLRRWLPAVLARFDAGEPVHFGYYALSRQGVTMQTASTTQLLLGAALGTAGAAPLQATTLPWSAFSKMRLERHWIRLVRPGLTTDWYIPYNALPNSHLLLALLAQRAQLES